MIMKLLSIRLQIIDINNRSTSIFLSLVTMYIEWVGLISISEVSRSMYVLTIEDLNMPKGAKGQGPPIKVGGREAH